MTEHWEEIVGRTPDPEPAKQPAHQRPLHIVTPLCGYCSNGWLEDLDEHLPVRRCPCRTPKEETED